MRKLGLIIMILIISAQLKSQNYTRSVGVRGGFSSGLTYQTTMDNQVDFKGLLSFRENGMQVTGMLIKTEPCPYIYNEHFFAYYGYGGHAGYVDRYYKERKHADNYYDYSHSYRNYSPVIGLDAVAGVDYVFTKIPFSAGLEFKPFFELFGRKFFRVNLFDGGFTLKYNF